MTSEAGLAPAGRQICPMEMLFSRLWRPYQRFTRPREKTTAEADLKNANEQLDLLKTEAREKFQTDDVDALKRKLAEMQAENEARRVEYQKHLDEINAKLAAVEQQFGRGTGSEPK